MFGHVGLTHTKDGTVGGRGMAVAGLVLGYLVLIPGLLILLTAVGAFRA